METKNEVLIVGGGASGTALLYALARYTDIPHITLVEKYSELGSVNSNAKNNSQTLHVGDIETNYSIEKAREVKSAAMMVKRYTESLSKSDREKIIHQVQKMVLAVGTNEVEILNNRYDSLKKIFPNLEKLDGAGVEHKEPEVMRGRNPKEPVLALYNPAGYAVDYGLLAKSLAQEAKRLGGDRITVLTSRAVTDIVKNEKNYTLHTKDGVLTTNILVVDADAHSLSFAKKMGLGKEFSLIPIAGNFYFSKTLLRGKVYRVQEPRMPFAAIHGDPDLTKGGVTRWGPTARFFPVLEARNLLTMGSFFASAGLHRPSTWISFATILLEPIRTWYLFKNFIYDLPVIGIYALIPQIRKIIPSIRAKDLYSARGYGGMRLQRVDTTTRELLLGEGKILGRNSIFNMTPSPGASVCLYNAMRDIEKIIEFNPKYSFNKKQMLAELCEIDAPISGADVSLLDSYAS